MFHLPHIFGHIRHLRQTSMNNNIELKEEGDVSQLVSWLVGKPIRMLINSKCYALRAQLLWVKRKMHLGIQNPES